jgi:serine protease AprX
VATFTAVQVLALNSNFERVDAQRTENTVSLSTDVISKFNNDLISELSQEKTGYYDVIIVSDPNGPLDYAERAVDAVDNLVVTKNWNKFHIFQSNLTKDQIFNLAKLPFVKRMENNSFEIVGTMDDAKSYTQVIDLQDDVPSMDGNADGSSAYSEDDIVIAILDTGINTNHYDLDGGKVIGWVDLIGDFWTIKWGSPYDDNGHGTHCASIAAGTGDATYAYRGVAPGAALVGVKMLNWFTGTSKCIAIDALDWVADNKDEYGIDIASLSWGFFDYGEYESVAQAADDLVHDYDVVVVVAAGNEGNSSDTIRTPGTAKWVITVGNAIDPAEGGWSLATDSGRGPCDDDRIKPDILAPGTEIMAAKAGTYDEYWELSGTSMATPFVAGLAAIFLDYDSGLAIDTDADANPDIKQLFMASAVDVPGDDDPGLDDDFGAGRIDALDAYNFLTGDISEWYTDPYLAITYQDTTWNWYNEPMWVCDDNYESDWYKVYIYADWFLYAAVYGDPDLLLKIRMYDSYLNPVATSTTGNYRNLGYWSTYSGAYYIRIWGQDHTGDYYDIQITTTAS